jgi:hypothetical protein
MNTATGQFNDLKDQVCGNGPFPPPTISPSLSETPPQHRMRMQITPPATHVSLDLHTTFATNASTDRGSPRHRGARPTQSTTTGRAHIATPVTSQRPMPASARAQDRPHALSCPPFTTQPHATIVVHPEATDTLISRPTLFPMPYSEELRTALAATTRRRSEPPPLEFSKSPYRCIPLPDIVDGPVILNPVIAYADGRTPQNELNVSPGRPGDVRRSHHVCAPATNPSVGSATILLPNGRGIVIHASLRNHSVVTVGDVIDALDTMLLGKPARELSIPVEAMYSEFRESCGCLSRGTALHSLRSRYGRAGLARSEEAFDVWDLRIG